MASVYSNRLTEYTHENGGRVLLLFLLFLLALYQFVNAGFPAFAIICLSPLLVISVYILFKWRMAAFWVLIVINYIVQLKDSPLPSAVPISMWNEMIEIILLAIAIIDARQTPQFGRCANLMLFALAIWCGFCTLQILNDTCDLGINVGAWYTGARMLAFQILYAFIIFSIYITTPKALQRYLMLWALLSLFSVFWTYKQKYIGLTPTESAWLYYGAGTRTHLIQSGTLIRYWSTFSDAASYGIHAAAASVVFIIITITSKITWERFFFAATSILVIWGMFQSGTRTAIICLGAGLFIYVFLSKSIKIAIPFSIIFGIFAFLLIFTNIGQGNQQIRRMRSAFNKNDASANVRDINKAAIRKYIVDAPWGLGIGANYNNIPANNKYRKLSEIPPDSEYVYIWVHAGVIGLTVFIITNIMMFLGACRITLFKLKSKSLIGIGAGLCGSFVAIHLGGYGNHIMMQFPNCLTFYGGLTIVYLLPHLEPEWIKYEEQRLAKQTERKRLRLEKKQASRV